MLVRPVRHEDLDGLLQRAATGQPLAESQTLSRGSSGAWPAYRDARVLVVDDSEVNQLVASEALERFAIKPVLAADGAEALEQMAAQPFDLVLMDGSMPVLDGFEATRRWRQHEAAQGEAHLPIGGLTAHVVGSGADAWRDAGMDGVLHKPFTLAQMADVLAVHLGPGEVPVAEAGDPGPALPEASVPLSGTEPAPQSPPAMATLEEPGLWDTDAIGRLRAARAEGRSDFVTGSSALSVARAAAFADLEAASASADPDAMARAAHALKSMSLNLGAAAVADRAARIERAIRVEDRPVSALEQAALSACLQRTLAGLDAATGTELAPAPAPSQPEPALQAGRAATVPVEPAAASSAPTADETEELIVLDWEPDAPAAPSLSPLVPLARAAAPAPQLDAAEAALGEELARAIATGALDVVYQPLFDRTATAVTSAEALVRWPRPGQEPVGPGVFVPMAEKLGLAPALDRFVRRRAFASACRWPEHVKVSVNVSPLDLDQPGFLDQLDEDVTASGLPSGRIILEVTETAVLGDHDRAGALFSRLRERGFDLALDDFGTGWPSLTSLRRHPFNRIKIDREFVAALGSEGQSSLDALAIIQAITALCRAMGREVVAEGVETPEQLRVLKASGIKGFQGYLLGKPMDLDAFHTLLARGAHHAA